MDTVQLPGSGITLHSFPIGVVSPSSISTNTIAAAGRSVTYIGHVYFNNRADTKTLSSAGGKIRFRTGPSVVFANAGTTLRIGVQDVNASGVEDGVFDASLDLVGATDTLTSSGAKLLPIETGSKTIVYGQLIAISFELISRGGADSVVIAHNTTTGDYGGSLLPYFTLDSGSGPVKSNGAPAGISLIFDDGTVGYLGPHQSAYVSAGATSAVIIGSSTSPDEYAVVFKLPYGCIVQSLLFRFISVALTDVFNIVLYSDPLGSPAVIASHVVDTTRIGSVSQPGPLTFELPQPFIVEKDTWYGAAILPTTTEDVNLGFYDFTGSAGVAGDTDISDFGEDIMLCGRTDGTGPFIETNSKYLPIFSIRISDIEIGGGGGGGAVNFPFGG